MLLGDDYVWEELPVPSYRNGVVKLKQIIDGFSSPNALVNAKALDWICQTIHRHILNAHEVNLLELYCGNGNHTVALASMFHYVVAVELNSLLCKLAIDNLAANDSIANVDIVHVDSQHFTKHLLKKQYYETADGRIYSFGAVLVDPPRAGLDNYTRAAVCAYDCVIYISCCMQAFIRDLEMVRALHQAIIILPLVHWLITALLIDSYRFP
jgi:tRNA (uracil-5-)-methyltransferase